MVHFITVMHDCTRVIFTVYRRQTGSEWWHHHHHHLLHLFCKSSLISTTSAHHQDGSCCVAMQKKPAKKGFLCLCKKCACSVHECLYKIYCTSFTSAHAFKSMLRVGAYEFSTRKKSGLPSYDGYCHFFPLLVNAYPLFLYTSFSSSFCMCS